MATFDMCNQYDQKTGGTITLSGKDRTAYTDLEQPKPKVEEKKPFSAKGLFGKMLGGLAVVVVAAVVVGVAAAYVASVVATGGTTLAAAPLLVTGAAFLFTSGFAAYSGASVLNAQYQNDLANKEDSGWGAYVGAPAMETVKTGARDLTWQMAIPVVGIPAGRVISKGGGKLIGKGGKLFSKMFKSKVRNPIPGDCNYNGPLPSNSWTLSTNGQGAHMLEKVNLTGRNSLSHFNLKNTPRYYPNGSAANAGQAHIRLHQATKASGISLQGGNPNLIDKQLVECYTKAYSDPSIQTIKGTLRTPDGGTVLGVDLTPSEAFKKLLEWGNIK